LAQVRASVGHILPAPFRAMQIMRGLSIAGLCVAANAATLEQSPISRVVGLITELKAKIEGDGKKRTAIV